MTSETETAQRTADLVPVGLPSEPPSWGAWVPPGALNPGPEMAALQRFNFSCTWTGTVRAGGMGPGSPEMAVTGNAIFAPIMDGAWLVGDFAQDQRIGPTVIINWLAHFVVGWNPRAGEYRIALVDNTGTTGLMRGWIAGNRFTAEPLDDAPLKLRMTWERADNDTVTWINEGSANGGPWFLIEEYVCTPMEVSTCCTGNRDQERILP